MFTDQQKLMLAENLDGKVIKEREQAGRKFSYIEGWHAIAEANRIFGFDGWSRETIHAACVWEGPFTTAKGVEMHSASYIAKVRVTVGGVVREGTGSGSGMAVNPGEAHESAIKEAETDAMKRALITFGNPFGLALYDKTQAGVDRPEGSGFRRPAPPPPRRPNVETDRHFGNAAEEIRSGQNGTPVDKKAANVTVQSNPKAWAQGPGAHDFLSRAKTDLGSVVDRLHLEQWNAEFAAECQAIHEFASDKRNDFLNDLISNAQDRCRLPADGLRGAA